MVDSITIMELAIRNFIGEQEFVETTEERMVEVSACLSEVDFLEIWN